MKTLFIILTAMILTFVGVNQNAFAITESEINERLKLDDPSTKPTFGLSHENSEKIVDHGFSFNNKTFSITDNFHTPFTEQSIIIGEKNLFEAKVYAEHGLKVQEFIFGIPNTGEAHLGETRIEIWYDEFAEVKKIITFQKSSVIDPEKIIATHEKTPCSPKSVDIICDVTKISIVFLEPLQDKIMAIKAIDAKNRYQITYLNEGFELSGTTLNPLPSILIPSNTRDEGLIQITQIEKYSPFWISENDRIFERNQFGSFKEINVKFERFKDSGEPRSRLHSGFGELIKREEKKAIEIFDAGKLVKEIPSEGEFSRNEIKERLTLQLREKMNYEEHRALQFLKESDKQSRHY
jgi:hypothetical protein